MEKVLHMLKGEGGHNKFWGSFNIGAINFSHTEAGGGGCGGSTL